MPTRRSVALVSVCFALGAMFVTEKPVAGTAQTESVSREANGAAAQDRQQPAPGSGPAAGKLTIHGDPADPTDVSDELKRIYQHIDANFDAHVKRLHTWVQIPNVSNTIEGMGGGVWDSAKFLRDLIVKELGCTAEIHHPGVSEWGVQSNPVVYGRCDVGAEKTVLDYIQADVMPVWPEYENWPAPPWSGEMTAKPPFKRVMWGKGISNHKGHEMAQLAAWISIKQVIGRLPVNIIFLADHDEEKMELGPRTFMFKHPERFKDADVAFGYAGSQRADGMGIVAGQSVGCTVFEAVTPGLPGRGLDQQASFRHFKMITSIFDENGPLIKEIAKGMIPPSAEEVEYLRREAQMTGQAFESLMRARMAVRVTITGTWGGNTVPRTAGSIVPPFITSKIDIRYNPNVEGEDVLKLVRQHLDQNGYKDVQINPVGIVGWSWANADNDMGKAIQRMYRQFRVPFNEPPKGNYMGSWSAYGPPYLFTRTPLQIPHLRGGLGFGAGGHIAPNGDFYVVNGDGEKIYGFAGAIKSAATVLYNYAGKNTAGTASRD